MQTPREVPAPVKLAVAIVAVPPLLAAGLAFDLAWAVRHRHLYRHEDE